MERLSDGGEVNGTARMHAGYEECFGGDWGGLWEWAMVRG